MHHICINVQPFASTGINTTNDHFHSFSFFTTRLSLNARPNFKINFQTMKIKNTLLKSVFRYLLSLLRGYSLRRLVTTLPHALLNDLIYFLHNLHTATILTMEI